MALQRLPALFVSQILQAAALHSKLHSHELVLVFHAAGSGHPHPRPAAAYIGSLPWGPDSYPVEPGTPSPSSWWDQEVPHPYLSSSLYTEGSGAGWKEETDEGDLEGTNLSLDMGGGCETQGCEQTCKNRTVIIVGGGVRVLRQSPVIEYSVQYWKMKSKIKSHPGPERWFSG